MPPKKIPIERAFSEKLRFKLGALGYRTWKMSERFQKGIPDIYMPTGRWIESKIIPWRQSDRNGRSKAIKYFDELQRWTMDQLTLSGDTCLVAILWVMDDGHIRFMLMPWKHFRHILRWGIDTVFHFSTSYQKGEITGLDKWFENGSLSQNHWDKLFYSWERRHNGHHYDETQTSDFWQYRRGQLIGGRHNPTYVEERLLTGDKKALQKMEKELDRTT